MMAIWSDRDIAYLVVSGLQILIASIQAFTTIVGLIYVYKFIRRQDKKDEKERLEKEERDKIADIINNEYHKIVQGGIDVNLKKCKEEFEAMVMFYGTVISETGERKDKITGLQVLKFMLLNPNDFKGEPLKKLQEDLEVVPKLFQTLRLKLPLKGDCPTNIKEELGPLITDIGETAMPFVSPKNRHTISIVLKYFGSVQKNIGSIDDGEREDEENNEKIRRILPYVNRVSLLVTLQKDLVSYNRCLFNFDASSPNDNYTSCFWSLIEHELINIEAGQLKELAKKIDAILSQNFRPPRLYIIPMPDWSKEENLYANIIHAVRVCWFEVAKGNRIIKQNEEFNNLVEEMKDITIGQSSDTPEEISERKIEDIQSAMDRLMENRGLWKQESIANMLTEVSKHIDETIAQAEEQDSGLQQAGMLVGNLETYL